jgi:uncharacterized protein YndB with AHSA1/START domain
MAVKTDKRKKYTLEYVVKSSPHILYEFLSEPTELSQWFADDVDSKGDAYQFVWEGNKQEAKLVEREENHFVKFRWITSPKSEYFEFRVEKSEITGDTILNITDFCDSSELKDMQMLWDSQVKELVHKLGALH